MSIIMDIDIDVEKEINNLIGKGVTLNDMEKWYLLTSKKQNKIESVKTDEDIKIKLKANFPKPEYREYQEDVLLRCYRILEYNQQIYNDKSLSLLEKKVKTKVIIIRSPTGSGKSPVAITLCRMFGDAYYVTPQKKLQEQLMNDFSQYMSMVKGRGNFECKDSDYTLSCSYGNCQIEKNYKCEHKPTKLMDRMIQEYNKGSLRSFLNNNDICTYIAQRNIGVLSPITLMNSAYFMLSKYTGYFGKRNLLVIDECHNIHKNVYDFVSIEIQEKWSGEIPVYVEGVENSISKDVVNRYIKWLNNIVLPKLQNEKQERTDKGLEEDEELEKIILKIDKIENLIIDFMEYPNDWVFNVGINKQGKFIKFRPIIVGRFMDKYVWSMADNIILMSGSIPNPEIYLKEVGLEGKYENKLVEIIDVPSTFPKENRLIVFVPIGKLTGISKEQKLPVIKKMAKFIEDTVNRKFVNKNGIVHCQSYDNLDMLYGCFTNNFKEKVILQERTDREGSLDEWLNKGGMFLSVNMREGLDLKDELCRFQFCIKVPFLNLGDKIIRKRVRGRKETEWYKTEAIIDIIQMYGRAVRSKNDFALFYILDNSFHSLYTQCSTSFPEYIKEVIRIQGKVPKNVMYH